MNKKIGIWIIAIIVIFILGFSITKFLNKDEKEQSDNKENINKEENINYDDYKIMIVYYSNSKTTERVAELLKNKTNADMYKIETVKEYPSSFTEISDVAKEERESGNLPELKEELPNISSYDVILIGGQVWSRTVSTPVMSYLSQTDFNNKIVSTFWTDIGKPGNYEEDFKNLVKNGKFKSGLELTDANDLTEETINKLFDSWLKQIFK